MRNRGSWLLAGMILLLGFEAQAKDTACTYGQNCLCDRLKKTSDPLYNPNVIFCEDFENPVLNNGDSYQRGVNGKGDGWATKYGPPSDGCLDLSQPAGQGLRDEGAEGTQSWSCFNVVQENVCEVESDCVFEGTSSLAFKFKPNNTGGIIGRGNFTGGNTRDIGITIAMKVTRNFISPKDPGNNGPGAKTNEWGNLDQCIMGCSTFNAGNPSFPFAAGMKTFTSNPNPVVLRGQGEWDGVSGYRFGPKSADYDFTRDWGKGNWGCLQIKWTGWGTSAAEGTYWFNGKEIISMKNFNMSTLKDNQSGIAGFSFNSYFNGADGTGSGYTGTSMAYRIEDNLVVTRGNPVSCEAVGFSASGAQQLGTPGQPTLMP